MGGELLRKLDAVERLVPGLLDGVTEIGESAYNSHKRRQGEVVSTTWLTYDTPEGPREEVLEDKLGLPTHYPADEQLTGHGGDLGALAEAQRHGRVSASRFALHSGENTGDSARTAQRREAARSMIRDLVATASPRRS